MIRYSISQQLRPNRGEMKMKTAILVFVCLILVFPVMLHAAAANPPAAKFDSATISGLGIRNIGPARVSGRIAALAAVNKDGKTLIYVGAASGGVWKSENGGTTFDAVFDKNPVQSIGAIAIDPANTDVV